MTPLTVALASTCPPDPAAFERAVHAAEVAARSGDDRAVHESVRRASEMAGCPRAPLTPELAHRYHVVAGVDAAARRDADLAQRHFWTAQVIRPAGHVQLGPTLAPKGALPSVEPMIPWTGPEELRVDGQPATGVPTARPCLVERLEAGQVVSTEVRFPDAERAALDVERERVAWAVRDLELAWEFLELRVAEGFRTPAVRLRALVQADLAALRELEARAGEAILANDARDLADSARTRADSRWADLMAQSWDRLSYAGADLLAVRAARQTSIAALDEGRDERDRIALGTVTSAAYEATTAHAAEFYAERARRIGSGRPAGVADAEPTPVLVGTASGAPSELAEVGLLTIRWPSGSSALQDPFTGSAGLMEVVWGQVPAGLMPIGFP